MNYYSSTNIYHGICTYYEHLYRKRNFFFINVMKNLMKKKIPRRNWKTVYKFIKK